MRCYRACFNPEAREMYRSERQPKGEREKADARQSRRACEGSG
jgi:hypothetical protein